MPRPRTTKGLAKRIELTYYKRLPPFRRWWRILCVAVPAAGALWLLAMAVLGDQRIYTSGPVVTAHRMFDAACERCHADLPRPTWGAAPAAAGTQTPGVGSQPVPAVPAGGWFFRRVSDGACLGCHDGAIHHETQTSEPACVTCHVEHQGHTTLARITDRHCTQCHADLGSNTRGGAPRFERQVVSLVKHPEVALFRKNLRDEAAIKLSHATHLKEGLPAGGGKRVTLGCTWCHREDGAGKYMVPIVYETHCADCHPLEAAPDLVVPHEKPEIVRGFLLARLTGRAGGAAAAPAAQPQPASEAPAEPESGKRRRGGAGALFRGSVIQLAELRWANPAAGGDAKPGVQLVQRQRGGAAPPPAEAEESPQPAGRRRGGTEAPAAPAEKAPAAAAPAGVAAVAQAEKELFTGRQGCKYCHTLEEGEGGLPKIVPPKIPDRWLPHSVFDHRVHRPLACAACHAAASKSVETSDVLVPKIQVCRECHRDGGGARNGCVECHVYHDRAKERAPDGPLTVPQFRSGAAGSPAS